MLARVALRMATIGAVRSKTAVGDNVLDSEITALDADANGVLTTDQQKPFITVYTDNGSDADMQVRGLHRSGRTDLVIEIAIAATMAYRNEAGDKEVAAGVPATDAAFELFLDVVGRQIVNALSDPRDPWAEIWRGLSGSIVKIERKRTSDATGTRIAAHQLVITLDLLPDPVFGEPLADTSVWARFFAKLAEPTLPNPGHDPSDPESPELIVDPEIAAKATLLASLVGDPSGVLKHEAQRRRFGLTLDEARALFDIAVQTGEATEPDVQAVSSEKV